MSSRPTIAELFDLRGKVAVVTGGAMGIGEAIAWRLAEAGAAVLIVDIDADATAQTVTALAAAGHRVESFIGDVRQVSNAQQVAQRAVDSLGGLDILVNNAGIYPFVPALMLTEAAWDAVLDLNLKGLFFFSQAAAQRMVGSGRGGRIINIASTDAIRPTSNLVHYDASKGGVVMVTRALAVELGEFGITVNAIAAGGTETPGIERSMSKLQRDLGLSDQQLAEFRKSFAARVPIGRLAQPDDIARTVLFLASRAADYVSGAVLVADGGFLQK